ncbi:hypothetical protein [Egbenema bharatensis]|uniref:hypothetical protein n=1 Tax=Egbenema bharatensis TaxID=3463334 RepID=UPI003A86BF4D
MKPSITWQEYQKLELIPVQSRPIQVKLNDLWQSIKARLEPSAEPHVWQTQDEIGQPAWSAYDPKSGQTLRQVSEAVMRSWLESLHSQPPIAYR